jgi:hypothetical protein
VKAGSNVEFVIVPNDGYELLNVEINGVIDTTCKGFTDYIKTEDELAIIDTKMREKYRPCLGMLSA